MKLKHLFIASLLLFNGLSFSFASEGRDEPAAKRRKIFDTLIDTAIDKTVQPNLLDMLPNEVLSQITSHLHITVISPLMLTEKQTGKKIKETTKVFNASADPLFLDDTHYNDNILLAFGHLITTFPNLTEIDFQGYKTPSFFLILTRILP